MSYSLCIDVSVIVKMPSPCFQFVRLIGVLLIITKGVIVAKRLKKYIYNLLVCPPEGLKRPEYLFYFYPNIKNIYSKRNLMPCYWYQITEKKQRCDIRKK